MGEKRLGSNFSEASALETLEKRTSASWLNIRQAKTQSAESKRLLENAITGFTNSDASVVVVGSLARHEFTTGSDVDWTLLLDGISRPEHLRVAHGIRKTLDNLRIKQPGREGVFGTIASSHDLIHHIGGQDDTNANTTLRILLLLESTPLGHTDAHERVLRNILSRYLDEDRGLWHGSGEYKVPRFLFNDVARYWRTMTVDFAYKQRNRQNEGFALRSLKLRMSRKLLFLAGMITCFECHSGFDSNEERQDFYATKQVPAVIERLRIVLAKPPLEILASALVRDPQLDEHSRILFDSYDAFLGMLGDNVSLVNGKTIRTHLDELPVDLLDSDEIAARGRDIAHSFRDAIKKIFLSGSNDLGKMTIEYGVF